MTVLPQANKKLQSKVEQVKGVTPNISWLLTLSSQLEAKLDAKDLEGGDGSSFEDDGGSMKQVRCFRWMGSDKL